MGMLLVPIFVGRIMKVNADDHIRAAVHSEYIFISLGVVAITVAVFLFFNSRKHPADSSHSAALRIRGARKARQGMP